MSQLFSVAVTAVIVRDGHVLLLKRSLDQDHAPGLWDPCSGRIEYGETPEQAVVREAHEETGLSITPLRVIDTFHFERGAQKQQSIGITFLCRTTDAQVVISAEHSQARWVKLGAFNGYKMAHGLREVLDALATTWTSG
ncbi:MAG: NUDIX domain-containing protein [Magnetovibrio sp.]|nr:NUDIX domain-containing protein [Magnetovibrio sp.]